MERHGTCDIYMIFSGFNGDSQHQMDDMDGMQHPKMVEVLPIQTSGAAAEGSCKAKRTTEQL